MPSTKGERYFVGDLQGCLDEFRQLLDTMTFDPAKDKVYLCGDLVARGPKSLETLRFVRSLGKAAKPVLGNHDLHLIATHFGIRKAKPSDKLDALLNAPDADELIDWLRHQPLMRVIKKQVALTHAGIYPGWSVKQAKALAKEAQAILRSDQCHQYMTNMYDNQPDIWQDTLKGYERFRFIINSFSRMRFCQSNGALEFATKCAPNRPEAKSLTPWFESPHPDWQRYTLVFGHWASLMGNTNRQEIVALDTGCVWGNQLTAWRLSDNQIFSVGAKAANKS